MGEPCHFCVPTLPWIVLSLLPSYLSMAKSLLVAFVLRTEGEPELAATLVSVLNW